jgi:predicted RNA binding protein YcfA (HicA-like mRNA interferase family)
LRHEGPGRREAGAKERMVLRTIKGDRRQFVHTTKKGRVTIAGHDGDDVPPGTLNSILKQDDVSFLHNLGVKLPDDGER